VQPNLRASLRNDSRKPTLIGESDIAERHVAFSFKEAMMGQRNEGEGNKTAAREYNRETTAFTKSGQVEGKAREAKEAIEGSDADKLRKAEREGKSHSHGEDRLLKGGAHKSA
jgi:hypothetical protein